MGNAAYRNILRARDAAAQEVMPEAPTEQDVANAATQKQLSVLLGGRTSTVLTGYAGEDMSKLRTSRVLLGAG